MQDMTQPDSSVTSIIRNMSTLIAGSLITHGAISAGYKELAIGVIAALLAQSWSLWNKNQVTKHITEALKLKAGSTREDLTVAVAKVDAGSALP